MARLAGSGTLSRNPPLRVVYPTAVYDLGKWAMTSLTKRRSCRIPEGPGKCIEVQEAMDRAAKVIDIDIRNMS